MILPMILSRKQREDGRCLPILKFQATAQKFCIMRQAPAVRELRYKQ